MPEGLTPEEGMVFSIGNEGSLEEYWERESNTCSYGWKSAFCKLNGMKCCPEHCVIVAKESARRVRILRYDV